MPFVYWGFSTNNPSKAVTYRAMKKFFTLLLTIFWLSLAIALSQECAAGTNVLHRNTSVSLSKIVAKARRKGFSYKNAAITCNQFNTIKDSYTLLCAHDKKYLYPKGIMTMAAANMDFLNEHTGWSKRRSVIDKQNHKKASYLEYINNQPVEKGYKSEVEAITFKDNPDAARGKDASLVIFEEAGAFQ